jgi:hypothetical protein
MRLGYCDQGFILVFGCLELVLEDTDLSGTELRFREDGV